MKRCFVLLIMVLALTWQQVALPQQTNTVTVRFDEQTQAILRAANEDHWFKKDAFFSTMLGGFLAALGGLMATRSAHGLQAKHRAESERVFVQNLLRAIRYELEGCRKLYDEGIGGPLKEHPDGKAFRHFFSLTENWFVVFDSNAAHLGKLDADLARRIISAYSSMKGLIEQFRINNEGLRLQAEVCGPSGFVEVGSDIALRARFLEEYLISYAKRLKEL